MTRQPFTAETVKARRSRLSLAAAAGVRLILNACRRARRQSACCAATYVLTLKLPPAPGPASIYVAGHCAHQACIWRKCAELGRGKLHTRDIHLQHGHSPTGELTEVRLEPLQYYCLGVKFRSGAITLPAVLTIKNCACTQLQERREGSDIQLHTRVSGDNIAGGVLSGDGRSHGAR